MYRAIGFPTDMFTVLFALGRLPGWMAQWREMINQPGMKISRPRQIYTGNALQDSRKDKSKYTSASIFYKNVRKKISKGVLKLF